MDTDKNGTHPSESATCHNPILVVEDDPDIRDAIRSVLEDEGYKVNTAVNGRDGLDALSKMPPPCLILLDMMMPVMSGYEFLAHLRRQEHLAPIPVIVVSAWPTDKETTKATQGFVRKPVDL